jgi:hypothetical protein
MKKIAIGFIFVGCLVIVGCQGAETTADKATTGSDTGGNASKTPGQAANPGAQIPADLQSDAYHYYGLSRPEPATYTVTIEKPGEETKVDTGTETISFEGMDKGRAKFSVARTGALEQMGSMHVALDEKGVSILSTDPGTLVGNPLDMPAHLTKGASWKMDYSLKLPASANSAAGTSEDHSTYTVAGPEKVTTKAGTFDAIKVTSTGNDSLNDIKFTLQTQTWFVKDMGIAKLVMTTNVGGSKSTLTIEATPGDPKK